MRWPAADRFWMPQVVSRVATSCGLANPLHRLPPISLWDRSAVIASRARTPAGPEIGGRARAPGIGRPRTRGSRNADPSNPGSNIVPTLTTAHHIAEVGALG